MPNASQEIKEVRMNTGLSFNQFFRPRTSLRWFLLPCALFVLCVIVVLYNSKNLGPDLPVWCILIGIGLIGWSVIALHLVYENIFISCVLFVVMIAVLVIVSGVLPPQDVLKDMWDRAKLPSE